MFRMPKMAGIHQFLLYIQASPQHSIMQGGLDQSINQ